MIYLGEGVKPFINFIFLPMKYRQVNTNPPNKELIEVLILFWLVGE